MNTIDGHVTIAVASILCIPSKSPIVDSRFLKIEWRMPHVLHSRIFLATIVQ